MVISAYCLVKCLLQRSSSSELVKERWSSRRRLPVVKMCGLVCWTSPSGQTDATTGFICICDCVYPNPKHKCHDRAAPRSGVQLSVLLTTPLKHSLSWRIVHHHWWSDFAALSSAFSASVFLFHRQAGFQKQKQRQHSGEMFLKEVQCLVHNLTCLLANSQESDDGFTCWLIDVIVGELIMVFCGEMIRFSRHLWVSWGVEVYLVYFI